MATMTAAANGSKIDLPHSAPTREAIALLNSGRMSEGEYDVWLEGHIALKEKAAHAKGKSERAESKLYAKTAAKGGISVYGLQRMPVTLYPEQWVRLFGFREQIEAHVAANPVTEVELEDGTKIKVRIKFRDMEDGSHVVK